MRDRLFDSSMPLKAFPADAVEKASSPAYTQIARVAAHWNCMQYTERGLPVPFKACIDNFKLRGYVYLKVDKPLMDDCCRKLTKVRCVRTKMHASAVSPVK